jgi:DNA-binding transcriptional regulator YdaS (Cro superfamily)
MHEALERAVELAGGQSAFARILGVTQPTVWAWLNSAKKLPAEHVLKTEAETGVSRHDLRPDIYPRETSAAA